MKTAHYMETKSRRDMTPFVDILQIDKGLPIPKYETVGAAGIDLYSTVDDRVDPGESVIVGTGIAMAIPNGWKGTIKGRSGLGFKKDIEPFPGTIDSDFRGEIKVKLFNRGNEAFYFKKGDRICQICIEEAKQAQLMVREKLDDTVRGAMGFGSTGS